MPLPRFSVILVTRDDAPRLGATLASVWAQELDDFELLVLDLGSSDGTEALVRQAGDPRLAWRVLPGKGRAEACNHGIAAARAPWLVFLRPGDVWRPSFLASRAAALAAAPAAAAAYGWVDACDAAGRWLGEAVHEEPPAVLAHRLLLGPLPLTSSNVVARKEALVAVGGYAPALAAFEDWDVWLRLARSFPWVLDRGVHVWHHAGPPDLAVAVPAGRQVLARALAEARDASQAWRGQAHAALYAILATEGLARPWEARTAALAWRTMRRFFLALVPGQPVLLTPLMARLLTLRALRGRRATRWVQGGPAHVTRLPIGAWRTGGERPAPDDAVKLAMAMHTSGHGAEAAMDLALLGAAHPDRAQLPYVQAEIALAAGRPRHALRRALVASLRERVRPEPFALAGHLLLQADRALLATALLRRAVALDPGHSQAWAWLAEAEDVRARKLRVTLPTVSVVVPVYNAEATLERTLDTILAQTVDDIEVLVVDDGSTDGSERVVRTCPDPRVSWHAFPNGGPSACRNRGAALARAKLLAWCDADDLWHPEKLAAQLVALELAPEADVVYSGVQFIDMADRVMHGAALPAAEGDVRDAMLGGCLPICGSNVLMRREAFMRAGGFDEGLRLAEDWDMWLRLSLTTRWARVPAHHVMYRQSPASASTRIAAMEGASLEVLARAHAGRPDAPPGVRRRAEGSLYLYLAHKSLGSRWDRTSAALAWRFLGRARQLARGDVARARAPEATWRLALRRLLGLPASRLLPGGRRTRPAADLAGGGVPDAARAVAAARDVGWAVPELLGCALGWQTLGRVERARQLLLAARRLDPTHSQVHYMLGDLAIRAGRHAEALAHATRSLGWSRAHAAPFALAGYALHLLGDSALGQALLERALALDPRDARTRGCLADVAARPRATSTHPALAFLARPTTLGVCMIVKDEARQLRRYMPALAPFLDELVVVDTGSSDESVAIARACGARVEAIAWPGDFAAARNAALDLGTTDWVLHIDADEELVADADALRAMLDRMPVPALTGVAPLVHLAYVNPMGSPLAAEAWQVESVPRLFPREAFRYAGKVHELPVVVAPGCRHVAYADHAVALHHHGYRPELVRDRGKLARNTALLEAQLAATPDDMHRLFLLGRELLLSGAPARADAVLADFAARWPAAERAMVPRMAAGYRAMALVELGRHAEALDVLAAARAVDPDFPTYWYVAGEAWLGLGRPEEAAEAFQAAIARRDYQARHGLTSYNSVLPAHVGAHAYARLRQARAAAVPADPAVAVVAGDVDPAAPAPAEPAATIERAIAALAGGDLAAAEALLAEAAAASPQHAQIPYLQAEAALRADDMDLTLARVTLALQLGPGRVEPWALAGYVLHQRGDSTLGERCLERALALQPQHPAATRLLAQLRLAPRAYATHPELAAWVAAQALPL